MVAGFCSGGSIPLHPHFGVLLGLTAFSLNGGVKPFGFHGVYMVGFFCGLYRRKLGFIPSVVSVSFPYPLAVTKSGAKVVYLCRRFYLPFPLSLCLGSNCNYVATKSKSETNKNFALLWGGFRCHLAVGLSGRPLGLFRCGYSL